MCRCRLGRLRTDAEMRVVVRSVGCRSCLVSLRFISLIPGMFVLFVVLACLFACFACFRMVCVCGARSFTFVFRSHDRSVTSGAWARRCMLKDLRRCFIALMFSDEVLPESVTRDESSLRVRFARTCKCQALRRLGCRNQGKGEAFQDNCC